MPRGISVGGPATRDLARPSAGRRGCSSARRASARRRRRSRSCAPSSAPRRLAQRVDVEQRLRRVLVLAVAGVDDRRAASSARRARRRRPTGVRMTIASGLCALSVRTVSFSDSPFSTLEPLAAKFTTSALRRLAASSKELRVRVRGLVEEVQDRAPAQRRDLLDLAVGRPRRSARPGRRSARSPARSRSSIESRCFMRLPPPAEASAIATSSTPSSSRDADVDALAARGRQVLADVVGADRQLAVAAVGEHGELDALAGGRSRTAPRSRRARCGR